MWQTPEREVEREAERDEKIKEMKHSLQLSPFFNKFLTTIGQGQQPALSRRKTLACMPTYKNPAMVDLKTEKIDQQLVEKCKTNPFFRKKMEAKVKRWENRIENLNSEDEEEIYNETDYDNMSFRQKKKAEDQLLVNKYAKCLQMFSSQ